MTRGISLAFILLVLAMAAHAQKKSPALPANTLEERPAPALSTDVLKIDDWSIQADVREPGEEEGDAMRDLEFDMEIGSQDNRPSRPPTKTEVERVFESEKQKVFLEAERSGDDLSKSRVSLNPSYQFYTLDFWQRPILKCCPRSWNYQCRSSNVRLPCFTNYYQGVREWCCPIWPSVFIKKCSCSQCAILTSTCAHEGRCQRRYSQRSFLAVCYRNNQWGFLRYITRYLPTSCYCRI